MGISPDHEESIHEDRAAYATWVAADGIRYLRPEIVLAYKARLRRPKDEPDLEATLPVLPRGRLAWLSTTLREIDPGHPWISRLQS